MADLRRQTFAGLGWSGAAQVAVQSLQFAVSVVLARLLGPREFGLMGMILVFTGFASILTDMGLGAAIIQRRDLSDRHLTSVFWINVGVGVLLSAAFMLGAPIIARFYGEPLLERLTVAVAVNFIFMAFAATQNALIERRLQFRSRFWIETLPIAVSGALAIAMAFAGAGVWSIVGQSMSLAATRWLVSWRLSPWRPRWTFDRHAVGELFGFSRNLLLNGVFHYWGRNIDKLLVGRFIGSVPLGLYNFAFRVTTLPVNLVTDVTNTVMFPAFAAIQDDRQMLSRVYLRSTRMIALVIFPVMVGLVALGEPTILFVYGDRWRASVGVVQLLAISAMAQAVFNTASWVFLSLGRSDTLLRLGLFATLVRVVGVIAGLRWGVIGLAWMYTAGSWVCLWYPTWRAAGALIDVSVARMMRNLVGPFVCTIGMGLVVWATDAVASRYGPAGLRVAIGIPLGVFAYGVLVHAAALEAWLDLRSMLIETAGDRVPLIGQLLGMRPERLPS